VTRSSVQVGASHPAPAGRDHVWRVTTAARVFVLALSAGLDVSNGSLDASGTTLLALCVLAAIMSALDFDARAAITWVPIAEAVLAAVLVSASVEPAGHVVLYLAVPALVAGLRHGAVSALNTVLAEVFALVVMIRPYTDFTGTATFLRICLTWTLVGLGVGLLAAWLRRFARETEGELGPYVAAHRLLDQLRSVSRRLSTGLDTTSIAEELTRAAGEQLGTGRVTLLVRTESSELVPLVVANHGPALDVLLEDPTVGSVLEGHRSRQGLVRRPWRECGGRVVLPLRVDDRVLGVVVAELEQPQPRRCVNQLQRRIDQHSLRLETAMLFTEVQSMATTEERHRLAREIHDGVAQEIASLGYLVDDLAASTDGEHGQQAARALRQELTRVVNELRLSIFDLRSTVSHHGGLGQALSDYTREVGAKAGMTVHLALAENAQRLRLDVETELLRIAQEAITNARKHSRANNLWVSLTVNASTTLLRVEDDGVGSVEMRDDHYGLRMMHERATRIGAELAIAKRPRGGTTVVVAIQPSETTSSGEHRDHLSPAR
jgi:signal transduction histidine kinase